MPPDPTHSHPPQQPTTSRFDTMSSEHPTNTGSSLSANLFHSSASTMNAVMPPRQPTRAPGKPPLPPIPKPPPSIRGRPPAPLKGGVPLRPTEKAATPIKTTAPSVKDGTIKEVVEKEGGKKQPEGIPKAKTSSAKSVETVDMEAERRQFDAKLGNICGKLENELGAMEDDIGRKEEEYIAKTWSHGNVMRGWEGFVRRAERERGGTGSGTATGAPKYRKSRLSDRIFSLSSGTSEFRKENPEVMILKKGIEKKKKKKR